jgi:hypothetical protein
MAPQTACELETRWLKSTALLVDCHFLTRFERVAAEDRAWGTLTVNIASYSSGSPAARRSK